MKITILDERPLVFGILVDQITTYATPQGLQLFCTKKLFTIHQVQGILSEKQSQISRLYLQNEQIQEQLFFTEIVCRCIYLVIFVDNFLILVKFYLIQPQSCDFETSMDHFPIYVFIQFSIYLMIYLLNNLSLHPSIHLSISIFVALYLTICLSVCLSIYLPIYRPNNLFSCLSVYLSIHMFYLSIYGFIYLFIYPIIYMYI